MVYHYPKIIYNAVVCGNEASGVGNSVDPDQTAPLGAV